MLIMPIIDFFATACDWLPAKSSPPHGLEWFVAASFFNGMVIEIGRKIRSPADEENGVQTYTRDWGVRGACMGFVIVLVLAAATAWFASSAARIPNGLLIVPMITLAIASLLISGFSRRLSPGFGKRFEILSGAWTLALYLWLGSAILF
jgi:4-hydroxybenzoate polyprenyltransferase